MGDDNKVYIAGFKRKACELINDMTKEVGVTRIDEDSHPAIDEIGVGIVLSAVRPHKGVDLISHFHVRARLPAFRQDRRNFAKVDRILPP